MTAATLIVPPQVRGMIDAGALVVVNHSGGKDSQAMAALIRQIVPADQIVVIHAHLAGVEWPGTEEHARATTQGLAFRTVRAQKTFFEMVEHRGMFPSPSQRQCTSDLKRDPINKEIRRLCKARDVDLVVNCMGLRAEESSSRAKQQPLKLNKRLSVAGRRVVDWLPVHDLTVDQVFAVIAAAGQSPHWAYQAGMTRLSCCFCIMASQADLRTAARLNPELYHRYVETEKRLNFTLSPCRRLLEDITGVKSELEELEAA